MFFYIGLSIKAIQQQTEFQTDILQNLHLQEIKIMKNHPHPPLPRHKNHSNNNNYLCDNCGQYHSNYEDVLKHLKQTSVYKYHQFCKKNKNGLINDYQSNQENSRTVKKKKTTSVNNSKAGYASIEHGHQSIKTKHDYLNDFKHKNTVKANKRLNTEKLQANQPLSLFFPQTISKSNLLKPPKSKQTHSNQNSMHLQISSIEPYLIHNCSCSSSQHQQKQSRLQIYKNSRNKYLKRAKENQKQSRHSNNQQSLQSLLLMTKQREKVRKYELPYKFSPSSSKYNSGKTQSIGEYKKLIVIENYQEKKDTIQLDYEQKLQKYQQQEYYDFRKNQYFSQNQNYYNNKRETDTLNMQNSQSIEQKESELYLEQQKITNFFNEEQFSTKGYSSNNRQQDRKHKTFDLKLKQTQETFQQQQQRIQRQGSVIYQQQKINKFSYEDGENQNQEQLSESYQISYRQKYFKQQNSKIQSIQLPKSNLNSMTFNKFYQKIKRKNQKSILPKPLQENQIIKPEISKIPNQTVDKKKYKNSFWDNRCCGIQTLTNQQVYDNQHEIYAYFELNYQNWK